MKKIVLIGLSLSFLLFGCTKEEPVIVIDDTEVEGQMFTERDAYTSYEKYETISLQNGNSTTDGKVNIEKDTITIQEEGNYLFEGTLDDGQIVVDAKDAKVQIILAGVNITNSKGAALYIKNANKVFVTMKQYSYNHINTTFEDTENAAIFSNSTIVFNGDGNLVIDSTQNGIVGKDTLKITSGAYTIHANEAGINTKSSVRIADGKLTVDSKMDSLQVKGFIYIQNGTFNLTSEGDGLDASDSVQVDGGYFNIQTNGGEESSKGIQSNAVIINGGNITIDSADIGLCSSGNIQINDGTMTISSGDDGIHADSLFEMNKGSVTIEQSFKGIEGSKISLSGGILEISAKDDGIYSGKDLNVKSGRITIVASNNGLYSKGSITMSGGTVYISSKQTILHYDAEATITGGSLVGTGEKGKNTNITEAKVGSVLYDLNRIYEAGTVVTIVDEKENIIEAFAPDTSFDAILICSAGLKTGHTYTVYVGDDSFKIEMNEYIVG